MIIAMKSGDGDFVAIVVLVPDLLSWERDRAEKYSGELRRLFWNSQSRFPECPISDSEIVRL